jgi:hypothetical protein
MAGPFAITSTPMLNACLDTRTNYIDITGEIEVFESMWLRQGRFGRPELLQCRERGLMSFRLTASRGTSPANKSGRFRW